MGRNPVRSTVNNGIIRIASVNPMFALSRLSGSYINYVITELHLYFCNFIE